MRMLVRLAILGLAGYGAKTIYERNRPRIHELGEPIREFGSRAKGAVDEAAWHAAGAADEAVAASKDAVAASKDAAAEVGAAARDAAAEVGNRTGMTS